MNKTVSNAITAMIEEVLQRVARGESDSSDAGMLTGFIAMLLYKQGNTEAAERLWKPVEAEYMSLQDFDKKMDEIFS